MPHTKPKARSKHHEECKAYQTSMTRERNKARKAAKRLRHLAKAAARRFRRTTAIA